jgi:PAS domain-containing protein
MSTSQTSGTVARTQSLLTLATLRPEGIRIRPIGLQNSLEAIVANAPCAIALLDDGFRHLAVSDTYCRELRTNKVAILHRTHEEIFPVLPLNWEATLQSCLAGESVTSEGEWSCSNNGEQFRINCQLDPWRKSRSKIGGTILFLKEPTVEKRQKIKPRDLLTVVEHAPGMIALGRPDGTLTFVNRAGRKLIGLDRVDESTKCTLAELEQPSDEPRFASVPSDHNWTGETVFQNLKTGEAVPLLLRSLAIHDDAGSLSGFACIGIDLRNQNPDSQEPNVLDLQIQHAQKMETICRITRGVAHDLNDMLLVINAYSSLLMEQLRTDANLGAKAASIHRAGQRVARLAEQLLALSSF